MVLMTSLAAIAISTGIGALAIAGFLKLVLMIEWALYGPKRQRADASLPVYKGRRA